MAWTCPDCDRTFARTGQLHKCERWTVDDHTRGKPAEIIDLFDRFVAAARTFGPVDLAPVRGQVGLRGSRRIWAGLVPHRDRLGGYLDLARPVESPRFQRITPYTKRLWVHQFRIERLTDLDDEFIGWIGESHAVGEGAHLGG